MSEIIVHTAVCDDVVRLATACVDIDSLTRKALEGPTELLSLGAATRHADRHSVRLLSAIRAAAGATPARVDQLTFILGWLTHRAADRQMKPVLRGVLAKLWNPSAQVPIWKRATAVGHLGASRFPLDRSGERT